MTHRLDEEVRQRLPQAFAPGAGPGLLHLGATEIGRILPPAWAWWRDLAARYVTALCATPEGGEIGVVTPGSDGGRSRSQLLSLLLPVKRAAEHCAWLRKPVDDGGIDHPLRWTAAEAYRFLGDLAQPEAAGIVVRTPSAWRSGRPARPVVKASVGERAPSLLGRDALLDFKVEVSLEGELLGAAELSELLKRGDGFQLLRGRWVEVNRQAIDRLLQRFEGIAKAAADNGLPFAEAMRLLAGASPDAVGDPLDADWSELVAGPWLAETLQGLRQPEGLAQISRGADLKATLRPYQQAACAGCTCSANLGWALALDLVKLDIHAAQQN
ncbi:SNF2 helicase-associated domain-containing protein [Polaromonas sp.]|uniref:SNF2 helicase-associated domain-containing protein n=1 Tax=Polaromonas sp. TaxID=1869339 RepID=UPI0025E8B236|nr:SNF2 helicase-associated domain-containing protein [Polaromonas sp.]